MSRFVSHGIAVPVGMLLAAELPHTDAQNTIGAAGKGLIKRLGSIEARMSVQEALAKNLGQRLSDTETPWRPRKRKLPLVLIASPKHNPAWIAPRLLLECPGSRLAGVVVESIKRPRTVYLSCMGLRDGTSCRVQNINYDKEIALSIPGEGQ